MFFGKGVHVIYKRVLVAVAFIASILLSACATAPIEKDGSVQLSQDQGFAAIVTNNIAPWEITQLIIKPTSSGKELTVPVLHRGGYDIFLIPAAAGRYCFISFIEDNWKYFAKSGKTQCFTVRAGTISVSGTFQPEVDTSDLPPGGFEIDWAKRLLEKKYPVIYHQYPLFVGEE